MFVVDTNVLVYAANEDCPEHSRCHQLLRQWMDQLTPWYVTWAILYEFLRIVTHPRVLPKPWSLTSAWSFIEVLLASPSLSVLTETHRHSAIAAEILGTLAGFGGNIIHDVHTVVLMREHGIRTIITRDTDFHRFSHIEPVDPLAQAD